jgi:hypothetical protein
VIRGCSTSEDPNARRLPCQAPVSLLPFVSQLLTMRSNRKPYVVALEPYSPKRVQQSSICRIQHAMTRLRQLIRSSEFLGPARLKGCEQPTGLVVLRELRVLRRWAHDLRNETMSTHGICRTRRTRCARPTPGLAERRPLCAVCVRGCAGVRQGWLGSFMPFGYRIISDMSHISLLLSKRGQSSGLQCDCSCRQ